MNELLLDQRTELAELAAIEAESIGWLPLGEGAYLHVGDPEGDGHPRGGGAGGVRVGM